MSAYSYGFMERMAQGKANVDRNSDAGGSSVTVYATAKAMFAKLEPYTRDDQYKQRVHEARMDCYAAVEFALFSHEWEGLDGLFPGFSQTFEQLAPKHKRNTLRGG